MNGHNPLQDALMRLLGGNLSPWMLPPGTPFRWAGGMPGTSDYVSGEGVAPSDEYFVPPGGFGSWKPPSFWQPPSGESTPTFPPWMPPIPPLPGQLGQFRQPLLTALQRRQ